MSHLALYRQFRPVTFDEIVGQSHITTTLKNQIKTGQISHAYLFCGSRGTGKTTAAKVFARAINCPDLIDGNPCLKCKNCTDQTGIDIIELDAASNNGVDYIRDIKEKASFSPINGKYKIYIVDEVHMLSVNAFNAFLKILEEPPSYAVFVLCTTEPQKIPQTILSRCMRFDFRLIGLNDLISLLSGILQKVGKNATPQAISAICTAGDGSVRDTLSIADRCLSFAQGKTLEYDDVMNILGATDNASVEKLANGILSGNIADILLLVQSLTDAGKNVVSLARDLSAVFRNILVCKTVPTARGLLALPDYRFDNLQKIANEISVKKIIYALNTFAKAENDFRFAINPKIFLETVALRVATSTGETDVDGLDARLTRLERKIEELLKNPIAVSSVVSNASTESMDEKALPSKSEQGQNLRTTVLPLKSQSANNIQSGMELWGKVLTALRSRGDKFLFPICESVDKVYVEENSLLVVMAKSGTFAILSKSDNFNNIQNLLNEFCPLRLSVRMYEDKDTWEQSVQQFKNLAGDIPLFIDGKKIN